jgi:hypothetical protein
MPDINLEIVLEQMKDIGSRGELMIVTHSNPKGLKMPLMKGAGVSAGMNELTKIIQIQQGVRDRKNIDNLPAKRQFSAWRTWFQTFDPGVNLATDAETNPEWTKFVHQKFDEWFQRQGRTVLKLPNPKSDLERFLTLLDAVQKLNFQRLEFRACRLGTDPDSLKMIAALVNGVNNANISIVAPKEVRTFYGVIGHATIVADVTEFRRQSQAPGAPRSGGLRHRKRVIPTRVFADKITFFINPTTFTVIAVDESAVKDFISKNISGTFSGAVKPFVIGGLEPSSPATSVPGKPQIFPLETEYKSLLHYLKASAPAPTP